MQTCIIIEDQPPAQRILQKYIQDIGNLQLKSTFSDALTALEFLKDTPVEVIFLDIHLPKISGIDFLKILPTKPKIILTTAFPDYALQSYELDVVDYLLKPFSFERFVKAVSKATYQKENMTITPTSTLPKQEITLEKFLFVKAGKDYQKIDVAAIQFIKSNGDYTQLFMTHGKHLVSHPLKYWLNKLDAANFCQIHKSYLVNIRHISKVTGNQVYIGDNLLPIGRTYREGFINDYLEGDKE